MPRILKYKRNGKVIGKARICYRCGKPFPMANKMRICPMCQKEVFESENQDKSDSVSPTLKS